MGDSTPLQQQSSSELNAGSDAAGPALGGFQHASNSGQGNSSSGAGHNEGAQVSIHPFQKRTTTIWRDTITWYKILNSKYKIDLEAWSKSMKVEFGKLQDCIT